MKKLNVLFIPTASSAIAWWRIQNFVETAYKLGAANFINPLWIKDSNSPQIWQEKITTYPMYEPGDPRDKYDPIFIRAFTPMIESGCQNADVVVFQSLHEEGALELLESIRIRFPRLPVLTEIDDNILSVPVYNEGHGTFDPNSDVRRRAVEQMRQSDGVITTTPYLKDIFSEFNRNIYVVPNSINLDMWDSVKRVSKPGIRIGWAGGNSREGDFEEVLPNILRIANNHNDVRFVFINGPAKQGLPDVLKDHPRIIHKQRWVAIKKYPKMLIQEDFDIGIAPMRDSGFNRGKSNLKWLENSAMGIPTVASNVGHFAHTLDDGYDAMLVNDGEEFEQALEKLIQDKKARTKMGAAAKERVKKDFNVEKTVFDYVACLERVIEDKKNDTAVVVGSTEKTEVMQ